MGLRARRSQAEGRGHYSLRWLARPELQPVLFARLLHVLAEVCAPGAGEGSRCQVLRVLHRHARFRQRVRGILTNAFAKKAFTCCADARTASWSETVRSTSTVRTSSADRLIDVPVDMVVLSVGLQPSKGSAELAGKLNIPRDNDGWFRELNYNAEPNSTGREGIYLAGVCQGPKDIPASRRRSDRPCMRLRQRAEVMAGGNSSVPRRAACPRHHRTTPGRSPP